MTQTADIPENQCLQGIVGDALTIIRCDGGLQEEGSDLAFVVGISVGLSSLFCICFVIVAAIAIVFFLQYQKLEDLRKKNMQKLEEFELPLLTNVIVNEKIGAGQFGDVFKGNWSGHSVALKSIKDQDIEAFSNELKIMSELRHPYLLVFYGIYLSTTSPQVFMVTEYMKKGDLLNLLHEDYSIPTPTLLKL